MAMSQILRWQDRAYSQGVLDLANPWLLDIALDFEVGSVHCIG